MKNKLLNSVKPLSISIALSLSSFSAQHILAAEFTAPQALFPDKLGVITPQLNIVEEESSDIYIAYRVNGEGYYYFISEEDGIGVEALPYTSIDSFTGLVNLPQFETSTLPTLQAQLFHVSVKPGESVYEVNNWIGGAEGLSILNFSVGQTHDFDGDWNNDGWSDDDLNKDGFHDDDLDYNGYHDDDLNKNGSHDSDEVVEEPVVDTVTRGKATYDLECSTCHGIDPSAGRDGILGARSAANSRSAIVRNKGGMGYLSYLTDTDLQDIADYINSL